MDIFELLRIEHAAIRSLLDEIIEKTSSPIENDQGPDWPELLHDLKLSLVAHNRAEEATLYDVIGRIPHRSELSDIKTEEHHLAEELLEDLEEINPADYDWSTKLALLQNQIESHVAEEETSVFSIAQSYINDEEGERLAQEFETLRDDIVQSAKYHPKGRSIINPAGLDLES